MCFTNDFAPGRFGGRGDIFWRWALWGVISGEYVGFGQGSTGGGGGGDFFKIRMDLNVFNVVITCLWFDVGWIIRESRKIYYIKMFFFIQEVKRS